MYMKKAGKSYHFRFGVLTPLVHGRPTLFAAVDAFPAFLPHGRVEEALSSGHRLLILPLPLHLGVLDEALRVGTGAGTLALLPALLSALVDHVLLLGQSQGG